MSSYKSPAHHGCTQSLHLWKGYLEAGKAFKTFHEWWQFQIAGRPLCLSGFQQEKEEGTVVFQLFFAPLPGGRG